MYFWSQSWVTVLLRNVLKPLLNTIQHKLDSTICLRVPICASACEERGRYWPLVKWVQTCPFWTLSQLIFLSAFTEHSRTTKTHTEFKEREGSRGQRTFHSPSMTWTWKREQSGLKENLLWVQYTIQQGGEFSSETCLRSTLPLKLIISSPHLLFGSAEHLKSLTERGNCFGGLSLRACCSLMLLSSNWLIKTASAISQCVQNNFKVAYKIPQPILEFSYHALQNIMI